MTLIEKIKASLNGENVPKAQYSELEAKFKALELEHTTKTAEFAKITAERDSLAKQTSEIEALFKSQDDALKDAGVKGNTEIKDEPELTLAQLREQASKLGSAEERMAFFEKHKLI